VLRLLRELAEPGRVVIVATHDERLLPWADRVVHLSRPVIGASRLPERFQYQASQVVFEQGAPSDLVYIVEDGQIEIVRQRADGTEELAGSPHRFARPWEQGDGRGG
jgi:putative ABC transport system ATP-binding protein